MSVSTEFWPILTYDKNSQSGILRTLANEAMTVNRIGNVGPLQEKDY